MTAPDRPCDPLPRRRDQVALAAEEVARIWDLGRWEDWHRTPKGSTNVTYFVTTDRGRFVVRISNPRKTEAGLAQEVALLDHLRSRGYPAPAVVATRTGAGWEHVRGALCLVTERIPGGFGDLGDPGHLAESARALARFHREGRDLPPAARPVLGSELPLLGQGRGLVERAGALVAGLVDAVGRERFARAWAEIAPRFADVGSLAALNGELPRMVTHGSLGISAVLFEGPRLTGVLDFERAANEARALDLAYTLRALTRRPAGEPGAFDLGRVRTFMSAYQDEEPLAAAEAERLPLVLRAQRLLKIAGKARNLVAKHATVAQEEKDAIKLIETLELEVPRLVWLERHEAELTDAGAVPAFLRNTVCSGGTPIRRGQAR